MTKEQKRIKSEEFLKNQEKIIEIWKSGDKVLALILGRTIMTDRQLLNFCQDKADSFSEIHAWKGGWRILRLNIPPITVEFDIMNIRYSNSKTKTTSSLVRDSKTEYNSFHRFLNLTCGPHPRKPKQI